MVKTAPEERSLFTLISSESLIRHVVVDPDAAGGVVV